MNHSERPCNRTKCFFFFLSFPSAPSWKKKSDLLTKETAKNVYSLIVKEMIRPTQHWLEYKVHYHPGDMWSKFSISEKSFLFFLVFAIFLLEMETKIAVIHTCVVAGYTGLIRKSIWGLRYSRSRSLADTTFAGALLSEHPIVEPLFHLLLVIILGRVRCVASRSSLITT